MRKRIEDMLFSGEHALFQLTCADVVDCVFAGLDQGEADLQECRDLHLDNCTFSGNAPLWHTQDFKIHDSRLEECCADAIWYCENGKITDSDFDGPRALRECTNIAIHDCTVNSLEFGWKCSGIHAEETKFCGDELLQESRDVTLDRVQIKGSRSFHNTENVTIRNCFLNGDEAFWHCENVTITDSVIRGERLGWYSRNLTLVGCKIIGRQPLCNCEALTLVGCTMEEAEMAFEYSDVQASIEGHVESILNPRSGEITVDSVGKVIVGDAAMPCSGCVIVRG